jgi:cytochrome c-type biogenesis protein CcmH
MSSQQHHRHQGYLTKFICMLVFLAFSSILTLSHAVVEMHEFTDLEMESDYRALIAELRCPKCQNQNLSDSDAPLAKDLRKKVFDQLSDGKNRSEIKQYMIDRYGDFITYRPPLTAKTIVLWGLPWLIVILAIFIIWRRTRAMDMKTTLSVDEQAALTAVLAQNDANNSNARMADNKDEQ